ncbi:YbaB/EbfC family nucleoid-associated protein [Actinoplanes philippinensis]|uniref:YbaB/EbfC family nucleoid-associated protein n=1 Tax=Actinoplanes philippinensis TaxID=35752 RepID=UPI00340F8FBF
MTVPAEFHRLAADAEAGLRAMQRAAEELGSRTVECRSADGSVTAVASLHGRMSELSLRHDALRIYDSESLGEAIADTIRAAQLQARSVYETEVRLSTPAAVGRYLDLLREACES